MGKGENASLSAFSPFPTIFSIAFYLKVMKSHGFLGRIKSQLETFTIFYLRRQMKAQLAIDNHPMPTFMYTTERAMGYPNMTPWTGNRPACDTGSQVLISQSWTMSLI